MRKDFKNIDIYAALKPADGKALPLHISAQLANDGNDQVYTVTIKADATMKASAPIMTPHA